jgi:hypothetical protein
LESTAIQKLEAHVGQLAKDLSERKSGEFPSQTIQNPRGQEELKFVTILKRGEDIKNNGGQ